MKEEKTTRVLPKLELSLNHVLVTTKKKGISGLITTLETVNRDANMLAVQEVVAVGPFVKAENGLVVNVGDDVMIDTRKIGAKNAMVVPVYFNKKTGEVLHSGNEDNVDAKLVETCILITDREILFKLR